MSLEEAQERHKALGRNDPCSCGSEKKYKKCHKVEDDELILAELARLKEAADAETEAKAEAEEEEGKAGESKGAPKTKTAGSAPAQKRAGKSSGRASAQKSKGDKAQSLPRRGAV